MLGTSRYHAVESANVIEERNETAEYSYFGILKSKSALLRTFQIGQITFYSFILFICVRVQKHLDQLCILKKSSCRFVYSAIKLIISYLEQTICSNPYVLAFWVPFYLVFSRVLLRKVFYAEERLKLQGLCYFIFSNVICIIWVSISVPCRWKYWTSYGLVFMSWWLCSNEASSSVTSHSTTADKLLFPKLPKMPIIFAAYFHMTLGENATSYALNMITRVIRYFLTTVQKTWTLILAS